MRRETWPNNERVYIRSALVGALMNHRDPIGDLTPTDVDKDYRCIEAQS
jgi:hypothetical protein